MLSEKEARRRVFEWQKKRITRLVNKAVRKHDSQIWFLTEKIDLLPETKKWLLDLGYYIGKIPGAYPIRKPSYMVCWNVDKSKTNEQTTIK